MLLHHIGIACEDLPAALEEIRRTHDVTSHSEVIFDPLQGAHLCMIHTANGADFELISGPQVDRLVKNRVTYYHVCYQVPKLESAIERMIAGGAIVVSPPKPAVLFDGRRVAFLLTGFGLVELLEDAL